MKNANYTPLEEIIISGSKKGYFFLSEDKSKITYRASGKSFGFKSEKERMRAYYLVELIEKYGFKEKEIQMDVETVMAGETKTIGLLVYRKRLPHIAVDFYETNFKKAKDDLVKKALFLSASFAVLISKNKKTILDLKNNCCVVNDFNNHKN